MLGARDCLSHRVIKIWVQITTQCKVPRRCGSYRRRANFMINERMRFLSRDTPLLYSFLWKGAELALSYTVLSIINKTLISWWITLLYFPLFLLFSFPRSSMLNSLSVGFAIFFFFSGHKHKRLQWKGNAASAQSSKYESRIPSCLRN